MKHIVFVVFCLFKIFSVFFTGIFFMTLFVLFFVLWGSTKDASVVNILDAVSLASTVVVFLFSFSLLVSSFVRAEFARMMRFDEVRENPFFVKHALKGE